MQHIPSINESKLLQAEFSKLPTAKDSQGLGAKGLQFFAELESKKHAITVVEIQDLKNKEPKKDALCIAALELYEQAKKSGDDIHQQFIVKQDRHYTTIDFYIKAGGENFQCFVLDAANDSRRWDIIDKLEKLHQQNKEEFPHLQIYLADSPDETPAIQYDEISCPIFALDLALHVEKLDEPYLDGLHSKSKQNEFSPLVRTIPWLTLDFEYIKHAQSFRFIDMYDQSQSEENREKLQKHLDITSEIADTLKGPKMRNFSIDKRFSALSQKALTALEQGFSASSTSIIQNKIAAKDLKSAEKPQKSPVIQPEVLEEQKQVVKQIDRITEQDLEENDQDPNKLIILKMGLREDIESYSNDIREKFSDLLSKLNIEDNPENNLQKNLNLIYQLSEFLTPEVIKQDPSYKTLKTSYIDVLHDLIDTYKDKASESLTPKKSFF